MIALTPSRMWETFLRIGEKSSLDPDQQPTRSLAELSNKSKAAALTVIRCLRDEVLPLVRRLEREGLTGWYSFLVHERGGDDPGAYIHLRLAIDENYNIVQTLREASRRPIHAPWSFTQRTPMSFANHEDEDWSILGEQSALLLKVIERHSACNDVDLLQRVGQFLHYFSNMTQLPVG